MIKNGKKEGNQKGEVLKVVKVREEKMPQAGKAVIKGTTPREGLTQPGVYNEERRKAILYFTTTTKDLSIGNKKKEEKQQ